MKSQDIDAYYWALNILPESCSDAVNPLGTATCFYKLHVYKRNTSWSDYGFEMAQVNPREPKWWHADKHFINSLVPIQDDIKPCTELDVSS